MREEFKCLHSGKCCEKSYTQICLTLGDIKRLSNYSKKSISELFDQGYIGIKPFGVDENLFELELGLTIPCRFRQNNQCEVYGARPINCRLFPFWILTELSDEKIKEVVDKSYDCVHGVKLSDITKERYKQYKNKMVEILEKEAVLTDEFLKKHNLKQRIDISKQEDYEFVIAIIEKLKQDHKGIELQKEIDMLKISFVIGLINTNEYGQLASLIAKEIEANIEAFASLEEIKSIETMKISQ